MLRKKDFTGKKRSFYCYSYKTEFSAFCTWSWFPLGGIWLISRHRKKMLAFSYKCELLVGCLLLEQLSPHVDCEIQVFFVTLYFLIVWRGCTRLRKQHKEQSHPCKMNNWHGIVWNVSLSMCMFICDCEQRTLLIPSWSECWAMSDPGDRMKYAVKGRRHSHTSREPMECVILQSS